MSETAPLIDHLWYGPPVAVTAAIQGQSNVIGPLVIDDVAYVTVRSETPLELPPGLATVGPSLARVVMGRWLGDPSLVPRTVTNFQARAVLMQLPSPTGASSLFADINSALLAGRDSGDPQGMMAWQAWEQANDFTRNGTLVNTMGAAFGLTEQQLDELFIAAAKVEA